MTESLNIQKVLEEALEQSKKNTEGSVASYIPELASVPAELTHISILLCNGKQYVAGDMLDVKLTLQSVAKLVVLIGLLEEMGPQKVFSWVRTEPSGDDFASVARLDQFGPLPSNPMLNSGAIALCSHIPGKMEERLSWLERWMEKLFGEALSVDNKVFASERRTGDRNRSLAYLMKSNGVITDSLDETLETYFYLCSFEIDILHASYLPMLLANKGVALDGTQVISLKTVQQVIAIMTTCGLYNESGTHLVRTGLPAKSGISGMILAVAPNQGGIAVASPRVNRKGTSIRGEMILEYISNELNWHFIS